MAHEIMENDNMFSVGSVPWHGIGNVLDNPPTIIEGLEKANLNWTVSTLPLFCQTPTVPIQSETRTRNAGSFQPVNHQAVMRNDTMEILGVVGQNWTPLQNIDAFGIFAPLVEDKSILLETAGSLKNGRRVWILARINADSAEIGKGDEIRPYVLLSNAHDGTMAVRFGFTPIRVVCNNTLSYAESGKTSQLIRVIHTPNLHENLESLRNMLDLSRAAFAATTEQFKWLASREINEADLIRYVRIAFNPEFEKELENNILEGKATELILTPMENKVVELFESGIGSGMPKGRTWWGAYNAVNEYLMYHRGRSVDNRLNSVWFADGYSVNKRALDTAIRLAA